MTTATTDKTAFIEDFFAHVDALDFEWVQDQLTEDCHLEAPGFSHDGAEIVTLWMAGFISAFPDLRHRPHQIAAHDDHAACLVEVTATHTEELALPDGGVVPPTNRALKITLGEFYRFTDGKVSEYRVIYDQLDFLTQLGLAQPPGEE